MLTYIQQMDNGKQADKLTDRQTDEQTDIDRQTAHTDLSISLFVCSFHVLFDAALFQLDVGGYLPECCTAGWVNPWVMIGNVYHISQN